MNLLFTYDNIYQLKDNSKIYIENKNSIDNFLYSKKLHSFLNIAIVFCTKDLNEILKIFRNDLLEDYDQFRKT